MEQYFFESNNWFTVNSYDRNYKYPPKKCGVYLLAQTDVDHLNKKINYTVLYVGSSKNLKQRYETHEKIRELTQKYGYVKFFFKEIENYLIEEYKLIKKIKPKYNKIGK